MLHPNQCEINMFIKKFMHANVTREDVKDAVCGLNPEQKLDPARNQSRAPSSFETSEQLKAIVAKPRTFKGLWPQKYPRI